MLRKLFFLWFSIILVIGLMTACARVNGPVGTGPIESGKLLQVVATTSMLGDVVRRIGGDLIDLTTLIPPGSDPHTFEPRPQDIAALSDADLVFINGLNLEEALKPILEANVKGETIVVSDGIVGLPFDRDADLPEETGDDDDMHGNESVDPHTWMDPNNVMVWTENISDALAYADPENASAYQFNAESYITDLRELDGWIREKVATIPVEKRQLVSDHDAFGYFANEYGFEMVGLVIPGLSTNAAPSAQELADLEDTIRVEDIEAIFVSKTVNPTLSQQVASDTGAQIVFVYTGSLGESGSEADNYIKFMRYNVEAIVNALK